MSTTEILPGVRLGPESAGILLSPDEFDAATDYDDCFRYELIHGVLVVTPMASGAERSPNDLLGYWLNSYRYQHPAGSCLVETVFEYYLRTRGNRRRADRVIWVADFGSRPNPRTDIPTIVVEFVSSGKVPRLAASRSARRVRACQNDPERDCARQNAALVAIGVRAAGIWQRRQAGDSRRVGPTHPAVRPVGRSL